MPFVRRVFRNISLVLIGALLLAQAAFATRPCVEPGMSAAAAVAAQSGHDCCETEIAEIRLCAIQCGDGSKLPGQKQRLAFDMPPIAVSSTPQPLFTRIVAGGEWLRLQRDLVVDPPPALRFCRLLN